MGVAALGQGRQAQPYHRPRVGFFAQLPRSRRDAAPARRIRLSRRDVNPLAVVRHVRDTARMQAILCEELIGRSDVLGVALKALEATIDGRGGLLFVTGEAGV